MKQKSFPFKLLLIALVCIWFSPSEVSAFFEMSFRADKQEMTLGDEVSVSIEIVHSEDFELSPIDSKIKPEPFELKRVERIPPAKVPDGTKDGFRVVLTIFALGEAKIPPITVHFKNPEGKMAQVLTQEIPIRVVSVGRKKSDVDDIRPIKSPYRIASVRTLKSTLQWLLWVVLLVAAGMGAWTYFGRRRMADPESLLPPDERALLRLSRLPSRRLVETKKTKEYYTELSFILERYLIEQFGVISEDLTTAEILEKLAASDFDYETRKDIRDVLTASDLAKFAKWTASDEECHISLLMTKAVIHRTRPLEHTVEGSREPKVQKK